MDRSWSRFPTERKQQRNPGKWFDFGRYVGRGLGRDYLQHDGHSWRGTWQRYPERAAGHCKRAFKFDFAPDLGGGEHWQRCRSRGCDRLGPTDSVTGNGSLVPSSTTSTQSLAVNGGSATVTNLVFTPTANQFGWQRLRFRLPDSEHRMRPIPPRKPARSMWSVLLPPPDR